MFVIIVGCSGDSPTIPSNQGESCSDGSQLTSSSDTSGNGASRAMWGFWNVFLNRDIMLIEFVPLRSGSMHLNVTGTLNATMGVSAAIAPGDSDPAHGIFAVDVTLVHPFATKAQLAGFDVKGILITPGTMMVGAQVFAGAGETRLINADGYSRWWNPSEFPGAGMMGYTPGNMGTQNSALLTATVNPYKYFCDYLTSQQNVHDITSVAMDNPAGRGVFKAGATNSRRYLIRFPMSPGPKIVFNYAIDASWALPTPNPPVNVPANFPIQANQPEPYLVRAGTTVNTLGFKSGVGGGGVLRIYADIYDWNAQITGIITNEISTVRAYAPELFTGGQTLTISQNNGTWARYSVDLSGICNPVRSGLHQIIIQVGSNDGLKYNSTAPGAPNESISTYQVLWVNVEETNCAPDSNNDFADAVTVSLVDSKRGSLCRPGGSLVNYQDFYKFSINPNKGIQGSIDLWAWGNMIYLGVYNSAFVKLYQPEVVAGNANINLANLKLTPGTYYIRVLTLNEVDTILYQCDIKAAEVDVTPPSFITGVTGLVYPRNKQIVTYSVEVNSIWPVTYAWTIENKSGVTIFGPAPGNGAGNFQIQFSSCSLLEGKGTIQCEISDGVNPALSTEQDVWVNGLIFSANMDNTGVGDNVGWMTTGAVGTTVWTPTSVIDDKLNGQGRKWGMANANYNDSSADILVSPKVSIPSAMSEGIVVFSHSFDMDIMLNGPDEYWHAYDGGNVKITEAPALPTYADEPAGTIGGRPYWSVLSYGGTQMETQTVFANVSGVGLSPFELETSVVEIPPAMSGKDIHIGFAATSGAVYSNYRGWLINDVKVFIDGDAPNAGPSVGAIEGGKLKPTMVESLHWTINAIDPDGDNCYLTWSLYDFSSRPRAANPMFYGVTQPSINFIINDLFNNGYSNRFHVGCVVTDGWNDIEIREAWTVGDGFLFKWDPNDPTQNYDKGPWDVAFDDGSDSTWTTTTQIDGVLGGYGYKFGNFATNYTANDHSVLFTPEIIIPPGFTNANIGFAHYYQFYDKDSMSQCMDGGNIHILDGLDYLSDFDWSDDPVDLVDMAADYNCQLEPGSLLGGKEAFCDDEHPATIRVTYYMLDHSWFGNPGDLRIGFAAATGSSGVPRRGWLIDEVVMIGFE